MATIPWYATARRGPVALVLYLFLVGGSWHCGEGVVDPGEYDAADGPRDYRILWTEGRGESTPHLPDGTLKTDLPAKAGTPCLWSQCGPNLICMANVCEKMCPEPKCNEAVSPCASNQACIWASDFTGACIKSTGTVGTTCGQGTGIICAPKTLCVKVTNKYTRCLKSCKACSNSSACCASDCGGQSCCPTSSGCWVCIQ